MRESCWFSLLLLLSSRWDSFDLLKAGKIGVESNLCCLLFDIVDNFFSLIIRLLLNACNESARLKLPISLRPYANDIRRPSMAGLWAPNAEDDDDDPLFIEGNWRERVMNICLRPDIDGNSVHRISVDFSCIMSSRSEIFDFCDSFTHEHWFSWLIFE